jgi:hypothetical protein
MDVMPKMMMMSNDRMILNDELERTWNEAVMAYFKVGRGLSIGTA